MDFWVMRPIHLMGAYQLSKESAVIFMAEMLGRWRLYFSQNRWYSPVEFHDVIAQNSTV
jgi:hypothetical protein